MNEGKVWYWCFYGDGFGGIKDEMGREIFTHARDLVGATQLDVGQAVEFDLYEDKDKGHVARNVRIKTR